MHEKIHCKYKQYISYILGRDWSEHQIEAQKLLTRLWWFRKKRYLCQKHETRRRSKSTSTKSKDAFLCSTWPRRQDTPLMQLHLYKADTSKVDSSFGKNLVDGRSLMKQILIKTDTFLHRHSYNTDLSIWYTPLGHTHLSDRDSCNRHLYMVDTPIR